MQDRCGDRERLMKCLVSLIKRSCRWFSNCNDDATWLCTEKSIYSCPTFYLLLSTFCTISRFQTAARAETDTLVTAAAVLLHFPQLCCYSVDKRVSSNKYSMYMGNNAQCPVATIHVIFIRRSPNIIIKTHCSCIPDERKTQQTFTMQES